MTENTICFLALFCNFPHFLPQKNKTYEHSSNYILRFNGCLVSQ